MARRYKFYFRVAKQYFTNKTMAVEGGTVSHYYILLFKFANLLILCRFSDIVCGFPSLLNNFPLQSLEYATYSFV